MPHLLCLSVFVWNCAPQGEQGIAGEQGETGYTGDKVPFVLYKLKKKKTQNTVKIYAFFKKKGVLIISTHVFF